MERPLGPPGQNAIVTCPKCRSKDFNPTPDIRRPLVNLGGKEQYASLAIRRYVCVCCGYSFKTKEEFYEEIVTTRTLFDRKHAA